MTPTDKDVAAARAFLTGIDWHANDSDIDSLADLLATARAEGAAAALEWTDEDRGIPEDDAIDAVHPAHTNQHHDLYGEAMRMVGAKRSKGALVDLVTWLLIERETLARWIGYCRELRPDYACAECVPSGPIVIPGFRCGYHVAETIRARGKP